MERIFLILVLFFLSAGRPALGGGPSDNLDAQANLLNQMGRDNFTRAGKYAEHAKTKPGPDGKVKGTDESGQEVSRTPEEWKQAAETQAKASADNFAQAKKASQAAQEFRDGQRATQNQFSQVPSLDGKSPEQAVAEGRASAGRAMAEYQGSANSEPTWKNNAVKVSESGFQYQEATLTDRFGNPMEGKVFQDRHGGGSYFVPDSAYAGKGLDGYMEARGTNLTGLHAVEGNAAMGNATRVGNSAKISFDGVTSKDLVSKSTYWDGSAIAGGGKAAFGYDGVNRLNSNWSPPASVPSSTSPSSPAETMPSLLSAQYVTTSLLAAAKKEPSVGRSVGRAARTTASNTAGNVSPNNQIVNLSTLPNFTRR